MHSVAEERVRAARATLETAKQTRDAAVRQYPSGIAESARAAQASLHAAVSDQEKIAVELGVLERSIETRTRTMEEAVAGARARWMRRGRPPTLRKTRSRRQPPTHASEMRHLADLQELRLRRISAWQRRPSPRYRRGMPLFRFQRGRHGGEPAASRDTLSTATRIFDDVDREIPGHTARLSKSVAP